MLQVNISNTVKNLLLKTLVLAVFLILGANEIFAQKKVTPLFKLGTNEVYAENFEYYFSKNNDKLTKDSVEFKVQEYLDLFIKFRLKVLEAEYNNLHEEAAFITEFSGYKKQLAKPYLLESKMSESLVQEVYQRMKEEVKASHILFMIDENALPKDTLDVFNRIMDVKKQFDSGVNFDSLAQTLSEDPSAKQNKGDLGYFSAFAMVYQFEEGAFNTPVGSVSQPIRTKFGYHLIHVKDRRSTRGKVKVAHIMLRNKSTPSEEEVQSNEAKINSVYEKIIDGENWNSLCELYSDDINTKKKGGVINWFGTGNLVKEFEEASFGLQNKEDISKPFQTKYGWHIVKLIDKKPIEPFEEVKGQLESKISRDQRSKVKKKQALLTLKKQNNFILNESAKNTLIQAFDSALIHGKWQTDSKTFKNELLFSLQNKEYSTMDMATYVRENQSKRNNISVPEYAEYLYNLYEEKSIFDFEEKNLEQFNNEYKLILQEYRDGILLFNLMEKEVWGKAIKDSVGLTKYYNDNIENYKKKESARVRVLVSDKQETIEKAKSHLSKSKKEIDKAFNNEEPLNLQVFDKIVELGEDQDVDNFWQEGIFEFEKDNRSYLLQVLEIILEAYKPMDTIKGQVISDYQQELEDVWIKKLKEKYPVKINKSTLKQVIKRIESQL
jgi:peptidyl-prolyl cis-trans isomerase SurA